MIACHIGLKVLTIFSFMLAVIGEYLSDLYTWFNWSCLAWIVYMESCYRY